MVELFTLNHGRMTLVARGAAGIRSPLKAQLQPFQPLLVDWAGRSDMKTLVQLEVRSAPVLKHTLALYSGLYINELLQRILPAADPYPTLFASYIEALQALSGLTERDQLEPVLRRFEQAFCSALGYQFAWDQATDSGLPVVPGGLYGYDPVQGIVSDSSDSARVTRLPGHVLQALAAGDYTGADSRRVAKRVMRVLIDYLLQGKPLHSRNLFSQSVSSSGRNP